MSGPASGSYTPLAHLAPASGANIATTYPSVSDKLLNPFSSMLPSTTGLPTNSDWLYSASPAPVSGQAVVQAPVLPSVNLNGETPFFSLDGIMGKINPETGLRVGGWGMGALNLANSLWSGYNGFQQMKTTKDALNFQKDAFSKQFDMQRNLINEERKKQYDAMERREPGSSKSPFQSL